MTAATIAEFLLARIADDEAGYPGVVQTRRDLAECAAKRRIVALHSSGHHCPTDSPQDDLGGTGWVHASELCPELALLAGVYASHPDFRPEWAV